MKNRTSFMERVGHMIPDPVLIFITLYVLVLLLTGIFGGSTFSTVGANGTATEYPSKICFRPKISAGFFQMPC